MFLWLLASLATAGTINIDASTPILVRIEGELAHKEPGTRVVVPDLSEGTYKVEITNLFGKVIAWKDVAVTWDGYVNMTYEDGYLDIVEDAVDLVYGDKTGLPLMPHTQYAKLERKLVKGSPKKKLKFLMAYTEGYGLTMKQTDDMLNAFHKREDRVVALYQIIDRVTEPSKYRALDHHFAVQSDLTKVHELFEAVLANQ